MNTAALKYGWLLGKSTTQGVFRLAEVRGHRGTLQHALKGTHGVALTEGVGQLQGSQHLCSGGLDANQVHAAVDPAVWTESLRFVDVTLHFCKCSAKESGGDVKQELGTVWRRYSRLVKGQALVFHGFDPLVLVLMPTFTQHGHREPQEALDEVVELGVGVGVGLVNRPSESLCGPQKGIHFLEWRHLTATSYHGHLF